MRLILVLALAGCSEGTLAVTETDEEGVIDDTDVEDDDDDDDDDTDDDDDDDDPFEDLLEGDCDPGKKDGRIDVEGGCVDGACAGMTYEQMANALEDRGHCSAVDNYPGWSSCYWDRGISTSFTDGDGDGMPDPTDWNTGLYVFAPFDGGTAEGLAVNASMACFPPALGAPDTVSFESNDDGEFMPSQMTWEDLGFMVFDAYTPMTYGQDGVADYMYLQGALEP